MMGTHGKEELTDATDLSHMMVHIRLFKRLNAEC